MRRNLLLSVCFLMASVLFAGPVTMQQAQEMAAQFLAGKSITHRAASASQMHVKVVMNAVDEAGQPYLYAVQLDNQRGFVIVSGSDLTSSIIGYSDEGTFDLQDMPENLRSWLQSYIDQIKWMEKNHINAATNTVRRATAVKSSVSPLLSTLWDQNAPYNNMTPLYDGVNHAATGCVATAMAQVMNYHKWPAATTTAMEGYTSSKYGKTVDAVLANTTIDWNNMIDDYRSSYTSEQGTAVANLMIYCGTSVKMDYGEESGASSAMAVQSMKDFFDYDASARFIYRSDYSYQEWIEILYNEIAESRPVLFSGSSTTGGHAFIVDGYDGEDFFHINWGWGGKSNGMYKVSLMNPEEQGIGGSSTNAAYTMSQAMGIGIKPNAGGSPITEPAVLTISAISLVQDNGHTDEPTASSPLYGDGYQIIPRMTVTNATGRSCTFDYGIRVTKDDNSFTHDFIWKEAASIGAGSGFWTYKNFMLNPQEITGLTDGSYKLVCISKESSASEWQVDDGSEYNYITFTIGGNTLNATAVSVTPVVNLALVATPTFSSEKAVVGKPYTITLQIKNSGTKDYHGDIVMTLTGYSNVLAGVNCDINAGETKDIVLTYIATVAGSEGVTISAVETNTNFYSGSITAENFSGPDVNVTVDNMSLNNSGSSIYGNCMKVQFDVTNNASAAYVNGIAAQLCMVTKKEGNQYWYTNIQTKQNNDQIAAGQKKTYQFEFKDLTYGAEYLILYGYYNNAGVFVKTNTGYKQIIHGIVTIDKDGNVTGIAPIASYEAPDNASIVDLRGQSVVTSVTPSSNPNCLYVLDEGAATPDGLTNNVIKGASADNIVLEDNTYGFSTPVDFKAEKITYTRTFDKFYNAGAGWTTIVLPFAATKVTNSAGILPWDVTHRKFWLMEFSGESGSTVNFTTAPTPLEANTPYIIALPGDVQGSFSLEGEGKHTLTFEAENADVKADAKSTVTVSKYKFVGAMTNTGSLHNIYALNDDGDKFEKGTASVTPFRAYFAGTSAAATATSLGIGFGGNTTGIAELKPSRKVEDNNFYNLNGQRVSQPKKGFYIVNGKKVVIK